MNQASNRLTWILGIGLLIALMTIAFLLGRESKPAETSARPVAIPEPVVDREPPEAVLDQPALADDDAPLNEKDGSLAEVVAYFAKVDQLQAGPAGLSADAFAQQLLSDVSSGKTDGFDQLSTDLDRVERELRAIVPPPACNEFHQLTLSAAGDAKGMIVDLRGTFSGTGGDPQALVARAQQAQAKTKQIEVMRKAIEKKYGLVH